MEGLTHHRLGILREIGRCSGRFLVAPKRLFAGRSQRHGADLSADGVSSYDRRGDDGARTVGEGTLEAVYWIDEPKAHHRSIGRFAFARIRLDGADSYFAAVDTSDVAPQRRACAWRRAGERTDMGRLVTSSVCAIDRQIPDSEPLGHLDVAVIPVGIDYVIRAGATQSVSSDILSVGGSWVAARLSTGRS